MSHTDAPHRPARGSCGIASGFCCSRPRPCPHPTASPHPLAARQALLLGFFAGTATLTRGTGPRTAWLSPVIRPPAPSWSRFT